MLIETYFWLEKRLASFRTSNVAPHTKRDINFQKWKKFCKSFMSYILALYLDGNNKLLKCVSNCIFERFGLVRSVACAWCVFMLVSKVRSQSTFHVYIQWMRLQQPTSTTIHSFMVKGSTRNDLNSRPVHWKCEIYSIFDIIDNKVFWFVYLLRIVNWKWMEHSIDVVDTLCHWICVYTFVCKSSSYMNYVIEYPSLRIHIIIQRYRFDIFQPQNTVKQQFHSGWKTVNELKCVFAFKGLKLPRSSALSLSLHFLLFPILRWTLFLARFYSDFHLYFSFSNVNKIESEWNEMMTITIKVSRCEFEREFVRASVCTCAFREFTFLLNYYITENWKMLSVFSGNTISKLNEHHLNGKFMLMTAKSHYLKYI